MPAATPSSEERWRELEQDRQIFDPRVYRAKAPVTLIWHDPVSGQDLVIGTILGPFTAQASFIYRPTGQPALEVPYRINGDFGLTAISPALVERMKIAGFTETVEAFIIVTDDLVEPQS